MFGFYGEKVAVNNAEVTHIAFEPDKGPRLRVDTKLKTGLDVTAIITGPIAKERHKYIRKGQTVRFEGQITGWFIKQNIKPDLSCTEKLTLITTITNHITITTGLG